MNLKYFLLACKQIFIFIYAGASLVAQMVRNPPAVQGTWIPSLDWEDLMEEDMATYSSILAWSISMNRGAWSHPEEPGFCLIAREEGSFICVLAKEFPSFPSHLQRK